MSGPKAVYKKDQQGRKYLADDPSITRDAFAHNFYQAKYNPEGAIFEDHGRKYRVNYDIGFGDTQNPAGSPNALPRVDSPNTKARLEEVVVKDGKVQFIPIKSYENIATDEDGWVKYNPNAGDPLDIIFNEIQPR